MSTRHKPPSSPHRTILDYVGKSVTKLRTVTYNYIIKPNKKIPVLTVIRSILFFCAEPPPPPLFSFFKKENGKMKRNEHG